ncbi:MAG: TlpA family protein disulfide reductase, partial [Marivirga sp.]|nr:TlpA family protein disulfide reductase [Marivirga sp.]
MKRIGTALIIAYLLTGCFATKETDSILKTGIWRATIEIQGQLLPFNFEVEKDKSDGYDLYLRNAEERILLDEVTIKGDSIDIVLHVFDADIKARIIGDSLIGEFIKNYEKDYKIPFHAAYGQSYRFEKAKVRDSIPDFSGKYEVSFIHESDTTPSVGLFYQTGDSVTGTFLTPAGDYRFLQGNVVNGTM